MLPPIYSVCAADAAVQAALGNPVRLYAFGAAPEAVARPYAVWQLVPGGGPGNFLAGRPKTDRYLIQVDIYSDEVQPLLDVAQALRDAIEAHAYITAWRSMSRDPETRRFRFSFDVDWLTHR